MSYVISPDPTQIVVVLACTVEVSPAVAYWPFLMGIPQESRVSPSPLFWPWIMGAKLPTQVIAAMVHGIPGTTTIDDEFPENLKPQFRVSSTSPLPTEYFVMYHGSPGVKQGDDNWDQTTPSYQPQMRLNTSPHTTDPTLVAGRWRYNEAFLAP